MCSRFVFALLLTIVLFLFAGGCTTPESDIPWNSPQPWEGSPSVPGLPQE